MAPNKPMNPFCAAPCGKCSLMRESARVKMYKYVTRPRLNLPYFWNLFDAICFCALQDPRCNDITRTKCSTHRYNILINRRFHSYIEIIQEEVTRGQINIHTTKTIRNTRVSTTHLKIAIKMLTLLTIPTPSILTFRLFNHLMATATEKPPRSQPYQ